MSIAIIKRCHHEHSRQLVSFHGGHGGGRTDIKCYYSGTWMRLKPLILGGAVENFYAVVQALKTYECVEESSSSAVSVLAWAGTVR